MIVVDASVALKWILVEEHTVEAKALYRANLRAGEAMVAPPLFLIEITNILRQRMRGVPPLSRDKALALLGNFLTFPVELHTPDGLHRQALILADDFNLPAAYDAHYLALAQHFVCDLWTADQRLIRRLDGRLPFVRWIGSYSQ